MSKKMMKRSLALGALMAFVITGSAMAREIEATNMHGLGNKSGEFKEIAESTVMNEDVLDINIIDTEDSRTYVGVLVYGFYKGQTLNNKIYYEDGTLTINANSISISGTAASALHTNHNESDLILNVAEKLYIDSIGHGINTGTGVSNRIIINGANAVVDIIAGENAVDSRGTSSNVEITAKNVTVESKATGEGNTKTDKGHAVVARKENANLTITATNSLNVKAVAGKDAVYAEKNGTVITLDGGEITNITGRIHASGCTRAEDLAGKYDNDTAETIKIDVLGKNITVDGNGGQAVKAKSDYSGGDSSIITIGNSSTDKVYIKNASYGIYSQYYGSKVIVNGNTLDINADKGDGVGVFAGNNDQFEANASNVSNVIINSTNAKITVADSGYAGIWALSHGIVDVNGGLEISADNAIVARGGAKVNIVGNGDVKIDGDIEFNNTGTENDYNANADNVHTGVDADVNINLTTADSYLKGNIFATDRKDVRADSLMQYVKGMKLALSNGAQWELSEASVVNQATFGKDTVLILKDGGVFETKTGENAVNVYALNAGGGDANQLTVEQGAKLAIDGIEENVTYNIAKGFGVEATVGENWTIDNNLLTGEWSKDATVDGLQVKTVAKAADEIASDMGVAGGTADALAGIITAVNGTSATTTITEAQQNVKDFADAIANAPAEQAADAAKAVVKMAEAGGNSATAASIVKNITGVTNDRLSFNCGHSAPHKGGHGVGLLEEGSGADIWVEYVHGKDEVEDMKSTAGATSYEGSYDGIVMGLDFKKVNKFQSGIAFNYGEGDTNSVGTSARTHSDYDFWGIGYYGNIHNEDSNVIFDINYAKTDSDVTNNSIVGLTYEASPETTTWTAGVKVEKLYQNENVQIVPYTGLRYMSIDSDDYATKGGAFNYKMERQDIWLLPLGVSIKQEVTNDNGWTVSPRVDLSYIWAFGDTDSDMEFATAYNNKVTNIGYDVMDDGSFLGLVGIEAHKDQWGFGVSYSYQKGDHSESKKWYVDVNYSF